jgi:hypothetical protein
VHGHTVAVEEATEVEVEPDGANSGDTEAVADEGIGGRAPGDPVDSAATTFLEQIPNEEEVVGVADLTNDPEFLGQLTEDAAVQGAVGAVTAASPCHHEAAQEFGGSRAIRRRVARKTQTPEVEGKGALLGKAERFAEWPGIAAAAAQSFGGGRKGEVAPAFAGIGLAGPGKGADGLDDLVGGGFPGMEITDLWKKKGGGGKGIPAPGSAGGGGDGNQAGGVLAEKGAGGVRFGKNLAEVGIAGAVADIEEDGTRERGGTVRGGSDLGSEDGLKAGFPGREEEFDASVEVGIGQPDRGKTQLSGPGDDGSDRQKRIMKAVVRPDMKRDVGNHKLLYKCIIS